MFRKRKVEAGQSDPPYSQRSKCSDEEGPTTAQSAPFQHSVATSKEEFT